MDFLFVERGTQSDGVPFRRVMTGYVQIPDVNLKRSQMVNFRMFKSDTMLVQTGWFGFTILIG
jgi:hypothetical protein